MKKLESNITNMAVVLTVIAIVAGGLLAGWIPARRAIAIKPIEALREE